MATIYEDEKGKTLCFVKGAPDFLLNYCSSYINADGGVSRINQEYTQKIHETIQ